jgi:hypothetical protein
MSSKPSFVDLLIWLTVMWLGLFGVQESFNLSLHQILVINMSLLGLLSVINFIVQRRIYDYFTSENKKGELKC